MSQTITAQERWRRMRFEWNWSHTKDNEHRSIEKKEKELNAILDAGISLSQRTFSMDAICTIASRYPVLGHAICNLAQQPNSRIWIEWDSELDCCFFGTITSLFRRIITSIPDKRMLINRKPILCSMITELCDDAFYPDMMHSWERIYDNAMELIALAQLDGSGPQICTTTVFENQWFSPESIRKHGGSIPTKLDVLFQTLQQKEKDIITYHKQLPLVLTKALDNSVIAPLCKIIEGYVLSVPVFS